MLARIIAFLAITLYTLRTIDTLKNDLVIAYTSWFTGVTFNVQAIGVLCGTLAVLQQLHFLTVIGLSSSTIMKIIHNFVYSL